ncbi:MAG: Asp23/Gls24 family envelope stress response protein [Christensenellales bacterium]|jgi:uncharacterized alkaline shock family protein YloU
MAGIIVNDLGKITIADDVIANIAGLTAIDCYGVVGMSPLKGSEGLANILKRDNIAKGIRVVADGNAVNIELNVVIEYGTSISVVASNIVDAVKYAIENLTGIVVDSVDVRVTGVNV